MKITSDQSSRYAKPISLLCAILLLAFAIVGSAKAEVTKMVATESGLLGTYADATYLWAYADMFGEFKREDGTEGSYRVPVTLIYPDRKPDKVGFVDLINSARFQLMHDGEPPLRKLTVTHYGEKIIGDYIWRSGYSYISIQWSKMVTEALGPDFGIIERGVDGYQIMADAADYLRAPIPVTGVDVAYQPQQADNIVSFGFSQPAAIQWGMIKHGLNRRSDGRLIFDGMLAMVSGFIDKCRVLNNDSTPRTDPYFPSIPTYYTDDPCPSGLSNQGKFINLQTETEILLGAWHSRVAAQNYRQYELAGAAHVTKTAQNLVFVGKQNQNPVDTNPYAKSALRNLVDWVVDGVSPPESRYIDGVSSTDGFVIQTDSDGNASGGVRLPNMTSEAEDGVKAGAPLGVYSGLDTSQGPLSELTPDTSGYWYIVKLISGTFEPFSSERLAELYPTAEVYQSRVRKAADALLKERFILPEDHKRYIAESLR